MQPAVDTGEVAGATATVTALPQGLGMRHGAMWVVRMAPLVDTQDRVVRLALQRQATTVPQQARPWPKAEAEQEKTPCSPWRKGDGR